MTRTLLIFALGFVAHAAVVSLDAADAQVRPHFDAEARR